MNAVFVFFEKKNFVECQMKSGEKMTCWNKKSLIKKIYTMLKTTKKRFFTKNVCLNKR